MSDERKKMLRPLAVGDLLAAVFSGTPTEKRLSEGKIWLVWDAAVGEQIAARARPVSFRDGTLTVTVASAPWMQQLTFLKTQIIDKLNEKLGGEVVREIYLKAGRAKTLSLQPEPAKKSRRQLTGDEVRRVAEQTASINDPELRDAFARLLTSHLADSPADKRRH
jgi:predicted nucleic acid-binding Zn ribbon protein